MKPKQKTTKKPTKRKKKNNKPNPVGRPPKEFNPKTFEELCLIQCTVAEIASVMGMCKDTLYIRAKEYYEVDDFSTLYKEKREGGKVSIRRGQFKMAEKNATMSIWLGRQYLDQKDVSVQEIRANVRAEVKAEVEADIKQEMQVHGQISQVHTELDLALLSDEVLEALEKAVVNKEVVKEDVEEKSDDE